MTGETMFYSPELRNWQLYFRKDDGKENRLEVARAFVDFWYDASRLYLEIPGLAVVGGRVFGHKSHIDGTMLFTTYVKGITKIHRMCMAGNRPITILRVDTASGSKYYLNTDQYSAGMSLIISDINYCGELEEYPEYYMKDFKNPAFL